MRNIKFVVTVCLLLLLSACGGSAQDVPTSGTATRLSQKRVAAAAGDTLKIPGYFARYTIVHNADGTTTLTDSGNGTIIAVPATVLTVQFADRFVSFDVDGIPGQAYRIYQAAFNRQPDLAGLGYWTMVLQSGASLNDVAAGFMESTEFVQTYGSVSDSQFLTLVYSNVLHRTPDQGGFDFWLNGMANGVSRQAVLAQFSESPENKENVAAAVANGIVYVPDASVLSVKPVQRTSYLNAKANGLPSQDIPVTAGGGLPEYGFAFFHAYGFADFFQDGSYSMVTHSTEYLNDPNATPANAAHGHIKFWKKDATGAWVDHTGAILSDDVGCLLARKVVVADFNGDGRPDVFFACSGYDAEPFPGEHPHILASQRDGTYKNITLDINCYCHGASAADINGDGYADIVVADFLGGNGAYFLKNNKDGTFSVDRSRLPSSVQYSGAIFSVELVDFDGDGKLDIWLAGNERDWPTTLFYGDGNGGFGKARQVILPGDAAHKAPVDLVFAGGNAYLLRTNDDVSSASIQKIKLDGLQSSIIYVNDDYYPTQPLKWMDWITTNNGSIVSVNSVFNVAVPE